MGDKAKGARTLQTGRAMIRRPDGTCSRVPLFATESPAQKNHNTIRRKGLVHLIRMPLHSSPQLPRYTNDVLTSLDQARYQAVANLY